MTRASRIFIATDFVMDPALDAASEELRQCGHSVVRGPKAVPGQKTVFPADRYDEYFSDTDVMVISTRSVIDETVLDAATRLKGIVFPSIGTESLDMRSADRRGLMVANGATPENFQSMSEATVMLMLNLLYDLKKTTRLLRENSPRPATLSARICKGKTIGLIGLGRIASGVAQRLQGWDVNIIAYNPGKVSAEATPNVKLVGLDELLATSDIVSIHTTLNDSSRHLIGAAELGSMKPDALLINTARGGCVDQQAIFEALKSGTIAGAALDAFEIEPLPPDSPLRDLDNIILTPHMVGHTQELFASFAPACVANVEAILHGTLPPYPCNPQAAGLWLERMALLG